MQFKLHLDGQRRLYKAIIDAEKDLDDRVRTVIMKTALKMQHVAKRNIDSVQTTGALRDGVKIRLSKSTPSSVEYEVFNDMPYAAAHEFGARRHRPPIRNIREWSVRHGWDPGDLFAKIAREGLKAHPFFFPAFLEATKDFEAELKEALK